MKIPTYVTSELSVVEIILEKPMSLTREQVIEFAQLKADREAKALVECGAVLASRKDLVAKGLELFYREGHLAGQGHAIERLCERHTAENEASPAKVAPV